MTRCYTVHFLQSTEKNSDANIVEQSIEVVNHA